MKRRNWILARLFCLFGHHDRYRWVGGPRRSEWCGRPARIRTYRCACGKVWTTWSSPARDEPHRTPTESGS